MLDHSKLPTIRGAALPERYEAAKSALAECSRVDECKSWADKAAALASYAKQAQDDSLERYALKVKGRAIRRAGELLEAIEPKSELNLKQHRREGAHPSVTRKTAAEEAGLSEWQRKEAIRVARVPDDEFEEMVEQDKPATITELAERGKLSKPKPLIDLNGRNPKDFKAATEALGHMRESVAFAKEADVASICKGLDEKEKRKMIEHVIFFSKWLNTLKTQMEKT